MADPEKLLREIVEAWVLVSPPVADAAESATSSM